MTAFLDFNASVVFFLMMEVTRVQTVQGSLMTSCIC